MDVTRSNFKELLPAIEKAINDADFMCVDGEFTGLRTGRGVNAYDSPSDYYQTMLTGSLDFLLVQFGLCLFKWDEESKSFKHCAYNFFLFPKPTTKSSPDKIFCCQSSSIDFLASQNFDFNKVFYEGIPYLSTPEELRVKENIEQRHAQENSLRASKIDESKITKENISIPEENKAQIETICEQVKTFLEDKTLKIIELKNHNTFIRKLLYQELENRFKNEILLETITAENQKRIMRITRVTGEAEMLQKLEEKHNKDLTELEEAVGFSLIARKMSESGKLIIGHCLLLDLLHILHQFFAPLPEDYGEFKQFAHCIFPSTLDTMFLASSPEFNDKIQTLGLESLLTTLSEYPFRMPNLVSEENDNMKGYLLVNSKYHEAGYDAFTTGLCFISMIDYILKGQHLSFSDVKINSESLVLKPFVNKIYLFKTALQDSPYIFLGGKDPKPSRHHVFHVQFPAEWRKSDLVDLFSAYGWINISYIDDTSAYVGLRKRNMFSKVHQQLCQKNSNFIVTPYVTYKANLARALVAQGDKRKREQMEDIGNDTPVVHEDLGQPISRDNFSLPEVSASNGSELKRRRTVSASSGENTGSPKRRRTSSGVFNVLEKSEDNAEVPKIQESASTHIKARENLSRVNDKKSAEVTGKKIGGVMKKVTKAFNENDDWE